MDLLDRLSPGSIPAELNHWWWICRTQIMASSSSSAQVSWENVHAILGDVELADGVHQPSAASSILSWEGMPCADTVSAALLPLPTLSSAAAFAEARRILRACGPVLLGRQLCLDGFLEVQAHSQSNLVVSLAE